MEKLEKLYEGKAKQLYATEDPEVLWVEYKNSATAGDGEKKEDFAGKGRLNNLITTLIFDLLKKRGIDSHLVARVGETSQLVKKVTMFPLEIVLRNTAAGHFCSRLGVEEGIELKEPVLEYFLKNDELHDPFVNDDDLVALDVCTREDLAEIAPLARRINEALIEIFAKIDVKLVDFKIEMGRTSDGTLLLADEINRTPPKTQSALLEAMEEQQVSADGKVYPLPEPFFVLATQNPIEQEGTYQLPEAQQDRFMFSLRIDYPDFDSELRVMCETTGSAQQKPEKAITAAELIAFQNAIRCIPVPESVAKFAVRLVRASRPGSPEKLEFVEKYVKWGAGPRACQYLALAGKALAALDGRFNVSEEDILKAAPPVMRHRLLLNFRAKSEGVDADRIIQGLVKAVR